MGVWLTRVGSHSMEPTLYDGQLAVTRSVRRRTPIRRGDLVVADSAELGLRVVKRVIGLPGEHVDIRGGVVSVDGRVLAEPYATPSTYHGRFTVPAGHYLLLGDNRDASDDARSWRQPYLRRDQLVGRIRWSPRRRAWRRRTGAAQNGRTPIGIRSTPRSLAARQ
jgi:signal peptidase I